MTRILSSTASRFACVFAALAVWALLQTSPVWAAGYEKAVGWSGRFAGMGGAAVSTVQGAESLYFNPAGLAAGEGAEVSVNLSPTLTRVDGALPALGAKAQLWREGDEKWSPILGALVSYPVSSRLGLGLGFYVAGGVKSFYENVDYTPLLPTVTLRPTVKADVAITEASLGAGYQLAPGLRLGAAWRMVNVAADFSSARVVVQGGQPVAVQNVYFSDLKDTRYNAFRVGLQYRPEHEKWGAGVSWRSGVSFDADGNTSGRLGSVAGTITDLPAGTASVHNAFPQQFSVGAFIRRSPELLFAAEWTWTQYSRN
ncbi:MAG: outer membrane protein transport protein, partial [Armatimonadota bacterium]|nr:outer membrane protein transport protein [Armatimonadota bacterium]